MSVTPGVSACRKCGARAAFPTPRSLRTSEARRACGVPDTPEPPHVGSATCVRRSRHPGAPICRKRGVRAAFPTSRRPHLSEGKCGVRAAFPTSRDLRASEMWRACSVPDTPQQPTPRPRHRRQSPPARPAQPAAAPPSRCGRGTLACAAWGTRWPAAA